MISFPKCHIEDTFFTLSRDLVNGAYDKNFFVTSEMLAYLNFCRVKYTFDGIATVGHRSFITQFKYINSSDYKQIIQRFIDNKFISVERIAGKITHYGMLFPPLINNLTNETIQVYPNVYLSKQQINMKKHNYIRLPKESFLGIIKDLTLKEIYVLLKLYRYNNLSTFGGCEDCVINKTNGFFLHENFYRDIYISKQEAVDIILKFIKCRLASWVRIVKEETIIDNRSYYFYSTDLSMFQGTLSSKHKTETILRLFHQPPLIKEDDDV